MKRKKRNKLYPNSGKPLSSAEQGLFKKYYLIDGKTCKEMSELLGHPPYEIARLAQRLGVAKGRGNHEKKGWIKYKFFPQVRNLEGLPFMEKICAIEQLQTEFLKKHRKRQKRLKRWGKKEQSIPIFNKPKPSLSNHRTPYPLNAPPYFPPIDLQERARIEILKQWGFNPKPLKPCQVKSEKRVSPNLNWNYILGLGK